MKKFCNIRSCTSVSRNVKNHHDSTTMRTTTTRAVTEGTQSATRMISPPFHNHWIGRTTTTTTTSSSPSIRSGSCTTFAPRRLHNHLHRLHFNSPTTPTSHAFFSSSSATTPTSGSSSNNGNSHGDQSSTAATACTTTISQHLSTTTTTTTPLSMSEEQEPHEDKDDEHERILNDIHEQAQHLCSLAHSHMSAVPKNPTTYSSSLNISQKYNTHKDDDTRTRTTEGDHSSFVDAMKAVEAAKLLESMLVESVLTRIHTPDDNNTYPHEVRTSVHRAFLAVASWCLSVAPAEGSSVNMIPLLVQLVHRAAEVSLPFHVPLYQKFAMYMAQHEDVTSARKILEIAESMKKALDIPVTLSFFQEPLLVLVRDGQMEQAVALLYGMKRDYDIDSIDLDLASTIMDIILERHDYQQLVEDDPYTMELVLLLKSSIGSDTVSLSNTNTIVMEDESGDDDDSGDADDTLEEDDDGYGDDESTGIPVKRSGTSKKRLSKDTPHSIESTPSLPPGITIQSPKDILDDLIGVQQQGEFLPKISKDDKAGTIAGNNNNTNDNDNDNDDDANVTNNDLLAKLDRLNEDVPDNMNEEARDLFQNMQAELKPEEFRAVMKGHFPLHDVEDSMLSSSSSSSSSSSDNDDDAEHHYDSSSDGGDDDSRKVTPQQQQDGDRMVDVIPQLPSSWTLEEGTGEVPSDLETFRGLFTEDMLYIRNSTLWKLPDVTDQVVQLNEGKSIQYQPDYETKLLNKMNDFDDYVSLHDDDDSDGDDFGGAL